MTSNALKIIAALSMLIDHSGMILFPGAEWMRAIGRIAMPIFAYFIAEGFRYTSNRLRYFLQLSVLGFVCTACYVFFTDTLFFNILITFSFSVIIMWTYSLFENCAAGHSSIPIVAVGLMTAILLGAIILFCRWFGVDYGFAGVMLPVCAYIPREKFARLSVFSLCLVIVSIELCPTMGNIQFLSFLSLPLLAFYNGKRGVLKMKYFFYIFYPLHITLLWMISYFR